jgi:metal-responsive CopG/Arc/MetJ family transcriptional regulator
MIPNYHRKHRIILVIDPEQLEWLNEKIKSAGHRNRSKYIREMLDAAIANELELKETTE